MSPRVGAGSDELLTGALLPVGAAVEAPSVPPLRVLHVLEAVGGGTLRHVRDLVAGTRAEHHVVAPAARRTGLSHSDPCGVLEAAGATVHRLAMSRRPFDPRNPLAVLALRRLVEALAPDVVHAHASVAGALARLLPSGDVPVVWSPHAVQDNRWALTVERRLARRASVVVALSGSERQAALAARVAHEDQLRVIPNGVARDEVVRASTLRAELGIPALAPVVGFVGRLCPQKAPLDFVEAARLVLEARPEAHAVCVGSGELLDAVLKAAGGLPAGRFHHVVRDDDAEGLLGAFDVLLTPSTYEGGPYLPLEAMAAGVPVVASDCAGLRDYVLDGVSGLTVPVGDTHGCADAVLRVLDDPLLRARLRETALEHLAEHHDLGAMATAYEQLYQDLARRVALR